MKKILAVAIATAFAAPAFAATSNVDVYGNINLSVEMVDNGVDDWNRMVTNNNSYIGFKGTEDLGGGLKAVWQIESNISIDSTGSSSNDNNIFGTRNTFIGLSSGFGTLLAGTHDTPYKLSTGPLDIFVGTLGDYNGIFGNAAGNPSNIFDLRTGNTIAYVSPQFFDGFDIKAAYVMGLEDAEPAGKSAADAYSLAATFKGGPLFVTGAYEKHNDVGGLTGTTSCNVGAVCLGAGNGDRDAWKIGAGFTIGNFKFGGLYESIDGDTGTGVTHDSWGLNAAYAFGGTLSLKASYAQAGDVENILGNEVSDSGAEMWALGLDYAMSKRTTVQLTYALMDNDSNGTWDLGQGPQVVAGAAGQEVSGFSLGVKHSF